LFDFPRDKEEEEEARETISAWGAETVIGAVDRAAASFAPRSVRP